VGYQAGYTNITGTNNTYTGWSAGRLATGNSNTAFGAYSAYSLTTGSGNTFYGTSSGGEITTGAKNTIIGSYGGNQGGLDIRTASNHIVLSDGDGNPRGYFDGGGNLLVNTTTADARLSVKDAGNFTIASARTGTGGEGHIRFDNANGNCGYIQTSGTSTQYLTSSDYRLKEEMQPMTGALAKVLALTPVTYKWKSTGEASQGFIAHELQAVVPECVAGEKDAVDADGNPQYQGIDTSFLVATLTAAIQELKAEFDAYKAAHP
jgi:hypothetical protein